MTKKHLLILALVVAVLCGAVAFLLKQESSSNENRVSENPASSSLVQSSNVSSIEPERLPTVERNVRPSEEARSESERAGRPYNFATRIATRPGYVLSPFSGKEVDVREIPPGTLVADPTFPQSEKKYFRVPE